MAPNVNLQRRKPQRDIEKLRKELVKQEEQQKKQQEKEQKNQQNKERLALLAKERCKRYYENKKQKKMAAEAANLQLNGGASISTSSFKMSSGLSLPLPNYNVECLRKRIWEKIDEHYTKHFVKHFAENEF
ncbi:hypothetical protein AVEN_215668-1 [Araneus ventricosus]|uniref:Uncharacterized protein n=1 Tax=Araneus ventricosus TaxID=182803 RepID=A0A4Y2SMY6_ARAVE|nr:hypothetical protein AVEN_127636-1 [Araneus ventricosus]GBN88529.1 hypothetical protein AVEN_215668-1 [Araneus ventricosus]